MTFTAAPVSRYKVDQNGCLVLWNNWAQTLHVKIRTYSKLLGNMRILHNFIISYEQTLNKTEPITKTRLFKYVENFTTKKGKFSDKKF